jgi:16S rRNA (cytidine1402-2'-O)-methyltransferase
LETSSKAEEMTHIFIEAPYRNKFMLEALLENLEDDTWLCVGWDLTMPTQGLVSQPVRLWKKSPPPSLEKKPAIFLIAV